MEIFDPADSKAMNLGSCIENSGSVFPESLGWIATSQSLPPRRSIVLYCTPFYQAAGFLDDSGSWRFSSEHVERYPVLSWTPIL
jgi:hypothetical protein